MHFERLSELRQSHGLTQKTVAADLKMQPNVYRRYEKGEREMPLRTLIRLAEYYHVSTDYLLGLTDIAAGR